MVEPSGTPAASATARWLTASMPSSAISRSVVCRSSSRRALPRGDAPARGRRRAAPAPARGRSAPADAVVYICTVLSYRAWRDLRRTAARSTSSSSAAGSSAPPPPSSSPATRGARVALVERESARGPDRLEQGQRTDLHARRPTPTSRTWRCGLSALSRAGARSRLGSASALLFSTGALSRGEFAERELPLLRAAGVEARLLSRRRRPSRRFGVDVAGDARPALSARRGGDPGRPRAQGLLQPGARRRGRAARARGRRAGSPEAGDERRRSETGRRRWRCACGVVAAGPWSGGLLAGAGIDVPLAVTSQSVAYFELGPATRRRRR